MKNVYSSLKTSSGEKWKPSGIMAAKADVFALDFVAVGVEANMVNDVGVISIRGPLCSHGGFFAGYDDVYAAFAACSDARAILLDIDSPGGDVSGMLECAKACMLQSMGKPVYAVANYTMASAAYALACVADYIFAPPSAYVGSVGVRGGFVSWAAANQMAGIDVRNIASGARKLDGDPDAPIDDAALAREQEAVNDMAELFFNWVDSRRGIDSRSLEGACLMGEKASENKLTDGVADIGQVLRAILTSNKNEGS